MRIGRSLKSISSAALFACLLPCSGQGQSGQSVTVTTRDGQITVNNFVAVYVLPMRIAIGDIPTEAQTSINVILYLRDGAEGKTEKLSLPFNVLQRISFDKPGQYEGPCGREYSDRPIWRILHRNGRLLRISNMCYAEIAPSGNTLRALKLSHGRIINRGDSPRGFDLGSKELPVRTLPKGTVENRLMLLKFFEGNTISTSGVKTKVYFYPSENLQIDFPNNQTVPQKTTPQP